MKVTSLIQTQPEFKSVTLELSPREAFLVAMVFGMMNRPKIQEILTHTYMTTPTVKVPSFVKGNATYEDASDLQKIYFKIMDVMEDAADKLDTP